MARLERIAALIDGLNRRLGQALGWTALLLIVVQFGLVILTGVFRIGSIELQESLLYINSLMFLGAAGYALLDDEHVRVDIFYRSAAARTRARINLAGTLILLFPAMVLLWIAGVPYVWSAWSVFEGSTETTGLQAVYILKSFVLLFAATLTLQGVSLAIRSYLFLRGSGKSGGDGTS